MPTNVLPLQFTPQANFPAHNLKIKVRGLNPGYLLKYFLLFDELPTWKNPGYILPYFFRVAKEPIFSKLRNRVQIFTDAIDK